MSGAASGVEPPFSRDANRALLNAYRHSIQRYQNLLNTYATDVERTYIKERLSACHAAIEALIGSESSRPPVAGLVEEAQRRDASVLLVKLATPSDGAPPPRCRPPSQAVRTGVQCASRKEK